MGRRPVPVLRVAFPENDWSQWAPHPACLYPGRLVSPPGEAAQPCHVRGADGGMRAESLPCSVQPVCPDPGTSLGVMVRRQSGPRPACATEAGRAGSFPQRPLPPPTPVRVGFVLSRPGDRWRLERDPPCMTEAQRWWGQWATSVPGVSKECRPIRET